MDTEAIVEELRFLADLLRVAGYEADASKVRAVAERHGGEPARTRDWASKLELVPVQKAG